MKFCIVGTGRSGTTLLYRMLNAHPDIFIFNETHWLPTLYDYFGTCLTETALLLDIVARTLHVTGQPTTEIDPENLKRQANLPDKMTVGMFCDALGGYFAARDGKSGWADKTPDYGFFVSVLQLYWPNCRILHLIRDGAATVRSMSRHIGYQALAGLKQQNWTRVALDFQLPSEGLPEAPIITYADLWYYRLIRIRDEANHLTVGSYKEIRFEDLIANPGGKLRDIARFVGLSNDADWLEHAASLLDKKRVERMVNHRPTDILKYFSAHHLRLMEELGYPADVSGKTISYA